MKKLETPQLERAIRLIARGDRDAYLRLDQATWKRLADDKLVYARSATEVALTLAGWQALQRSR